jgi:hypothetical protein
MNSDQRKKLPRFPDIRGGYRILRSARGRRDPPKVLDGLPEPGAEPRRAGLRRRVAVPARGLWPDVVLTLRPSGDGQNQSEARAMMKALLTMAIVMVFLFAVYFVERGLDRYRPAIAM